MSRKLLISHLFVSMALFLLGCQTPPANSPLAINGADDPRGVNCSTPYFAWQKLAGLTTTDQVLGGRGAWLYQAGRIEMKVEGSSLRMRQTERKGPFFADALPFGVFTEPFRSIQLSSEQASYSSRIFLKWPDSDLPQGSVLALGQLYKNAANESTQLVLTVPRDQLASEVFEWAVSHAKDPAIKHAASLKVTAEGSRLLIEHDGMSSTSSAFILLKLKVPLPQLELTIISLNQDRAGAPDVVEFAFAERRCSDLPFCRGIKRVVKFEPGLEAKSLNLDELDALFRQNASFRSGSKSFAIGRGGRLELELDGVLINRTGKDLLIDAAEAQSKCTPGLGFARIFIRASPSQEWQAIGRNKQLCGSESLDLNELQEAHWIRFEDISSRGAGFPLREFAAFTAVK